jgi:hypothetical protein
MDTTTTMDHDDLAFAQQPSATRHQDPMAAPPASEAAPPAAEAAPAAANIAT